MDYDGPEAPCQSESCRNVLRNLKVVMQHKKNQEVEMQKFSRMAAENAELKLKLVSTEEQLHQTAAKAAEATRLKDSAVEDLKQNTHDLTHYKEKCMHLQEKADASETHLANANRWRTEYDKMGALVEKLEANNIDIKSKYESSVKTMDTVGKKIASLQGQMTTMKLEKTENQQKQKKLDKYLKSAIQVIDALAEKSNLTKQPKKIKDLIEVFRRDDVRLFFNSTSYEGDNEPSTSAAGEDNSQESEEDADDDPLLGGHRLSDDEEEEDERAIRRLEHLVTKQIVERPNGKRPDFANKMKELKARKEAPKLVKTDNLRRYPRGVRQPKETDSMGILNAKEIHRKQVPTTDFDAIANASDARKKALLLSNPREAMTSSSTIHGKKGKTVREQQNEMMKGESVRDKVAKMKAEMAGGFTPPTPPPKVQPPVVRRHQSLMMSERGSGSEEEEEDDSDDEPIQRRGSGRGGSRPRAISEASTPSKRRLSGGAAPPTPARRSQRLSIKSNDEPEVTDSPTTSTVQPPRGRGRPRTRALSTASTTSVVSTASTAMSRDSRAAARSIIRGDTDTSIATPSVVRTRSRSKSVTQEVHKVAGVPKRRVGKVPVIESAGPPLRTRGMGRMIAPKKNEPSTSGPVVSGDGLAMLDDLLDVSQDEPELEPEKAKESSESDDSSVIEMPEDQPRPRTFYEEPDFEYTPPRGPPELIVLNSDEPEDPKPADSDHVDPIEVNIPEEHVEKVPVEVIPIQNAPKEEEKEEEKAPITPKSPKHVIVSHYGLDISDSEDEVDDLMSLTQMASPGVPQKSLVVEEEEFREESPQPLEIDEGDVTPLKAKIPEIAQKSPKTAPNLTPQSATSSNPSAVIQDRSPLKISPQKPPKLTPQASTSSNPPAVPPTLGKATSSASSTASETSTSSYKSVAPKPAPKVILPKSTPPKLEKATSSTSSTSSESTSKSALSPAPKVILPKPTKPPKLEKATSSSSSETSTSSSSAPAPKAMHPKSIPPPVRRSSSSSTSANPDLFPSSSDSSKTFKQPMLTRTTSSTAPSRGIPEKLDPHDELIKKILKSDEPKKEPPSVTSSSSITSDDLSMDILSGAKVSSQKKKTTPAVKRAATSSGGATCNKKPAVEGEKVPVKKQATTSSSVPPDPSSEISATSSAPKAPQKRKYTKKTPEDPENPNPVKKTRVTTKSVVKSTSSDVPTSSEAVSTAVDTKQEQEEEESQVATSSGRKPGPSRTILIEAPARPRGRSIKIQKMEQKPMGLKEAMGKKMERGGRAVNKLKGVLRQALDLKLPVNKLKQPMADKGIDLGESIALSPSDAVDVMIEYLRETSASDMWAVLIRQRIDGNTQPLKNDEEENFLNVGASLIEKDAALLQMFIDRILYELSVRDSIDSKQCGRLVRLFCHAVHFSKPIPKEEEDEEEEEVDIDAMMEDKRSKWMYNLFMILFHKHPSQLIKAVAYCLVSQVSQYYDFLVEELEKDPKKSDISYAFRILMQKEPEQAQLINWLLNDKFHTAYIVDLTPEEIQKACHTAHRGFINDVISLKTSVFMAKSGSPDVLEVAFKLLEEQMKMIETQFLEPKEKERELKHKTAFSVPTVPTRMTSQEAVQFKKETEWQKTVLLVMIDNPSSTHYRAIMTALNTISKQVVSFREIVDSSEIESFVDASGVDPLREALQNLLDLISEFTNFPLKPSILPVDS